MRSRRLLLCLAVVGGLAATCRPAPAAPGREAMAVAAKPSTKDTSAAVKPNPAKATATPAKTAAKTSRTADSLPAPADTLPPPLRDLGQTALKAPEKLVFDVIWGVWSFSWVHAGKATVELLPTESPAQWKIRTLAWCNKFFQSIYPVQDTVYSIVDARGIYPLRFEKRLHEGSYHSRVSALYDQKAHTLTTLDTTMAIDPFTHDVLSAFYYIRTRPLKVGDSFELSAVSGKKKYPLKVICHGRETVKVPAGEFKTLVVEPVLRGDGLFKAKGKLIIWLTDDAQHVPVKMQSKIPVGSIKAELVSKS